MNDPPDGPAPPVGERLAAQERRLRLLLAHVAGAAVRARVEPEDLVQEVFLRALASDAVPPHEPGDRPLARLLATIARHVVVDVARALTAAKRDGREERLERSDWSRVVGIEERLADRAPGPRTRLEGAETERAVQAAFESLAEDHREVLTLRQFEGLSAREAADRMERSETAVHSLYRRALAAWDEALGEKPDESKRPSRPASP